jgi:hypothetical protein
MASKLTALSEIPLGSAAVANMSAEELEEALEHFYRLKAAAEAGIVEVLGEVQRRESFRRDGATSSEKWQVERFGQSVPSARAYDQVAKRAWDLPHLTRALGQGEISFDKMRALAAVATPETDRELADRARNCTVHELNQLARSLQRPSRAQGQADREARSLRFNDTFRTMTVQLPPTSYTEVKACIENRAKKIPADGETSWDQRQCDAFLGIIRASGGGGGAGRSPYFVVLHTPLAGLIDESGSASELAGDLERGGLIDIQTVRRIACDATIVVAVDDDVGHSMYEGRTQRTPTPTQRREAWRRDRCCRFPGCANSVFADVHHLKWWKRDAGPTDLPNLCVLCDHHHDLIHLHGWVLTGNANEELTFVGPTGREITSRPSPMWTAASS